MKIGDECALALTSRGEALCFGENIDNQLGFEKHEVPSKETFTQVIGAPFAKNIWVGRNSVFIAEV